MRVPLIPDVTICVHHKKESLYQIVIVFIGFSLKGRLTHNSTTTKFDCFCLKECEFLLYLMLPFAFIIKRNHCVKLLSFLLALVLTVG